MNDQDDLPIQSPLWAQVMYQAQRDGFKGVHERIDRIDRQVQPLVEFKMQHDANEAAAQKAVSKRNKVLVGLGTTVGAALAAVVSAVLGTNK